MKMGELFSERPAGRVSDPQQVDTNCPPRGRDILGCELQLAQLTSRVHKPQSISRRSINCTHYLSPNLKRVANVTRA
jgi:hypothetical protein